MLEHRSVIDSFAANALVHEREFSGEDLPTPPKRQVAVVACMDSRIDLFAILGLNNGDAHIIRNAGGIATEDVLRSIAISQRLLKTKSIMLIQHTGCGLLNCDEEAFYEQVQRETGSKPAWSMGTFTNLDTSVIQSVQRIHSDPHILYTEDVRGFVYDVFNGSLREVPLP